MVNESLFQIASFFLPFRFLDDSYKEEYPKFWTGNNHKNEDSSNLYQNISIETNTPEYLFVQRLFNKSVPENDIKIAFVSIEILSLILFFCKVNI